MISRSSLLFAFLAITSFGMGQVTKITTVGDSPEGITSNPKTHMVFGTGEAKGGEDDEGGGEDGVDADLLAPAPVPGPVEGNTIYMLDAAGNRLKSFFPTTNDGEYIAVNPVTNLVFHSNTSAHTVTIIDPTKDPSAAVLKVLSFDTEPEGIAIDSKQNIIYIGLKGPEYTEGCIPEPGDPEECARVGSINVYDGNTIVEKGNESLIKQIWAGDDPESVVFMPDANNPMFGKVFGANEDDGTITIASAVTRLKGGGFVGGDELQLPLKVFSDSACSPWEKAEEADKMAVDPVHRFVFITDDKYRVARIAVGDGYSESRVTGVVAIPGYGCPDPITGLLGPNTANNLSVSVHNASDPYDTNWVRLYVVSEQNTISIIDKLDAEDFANVPMTTITVPDAVHLDAITTLGQMNRVFVTDEDLPGLFVLQGQCADGIAAACTLFK